MTAEPELVSELMTARWEVKASKTHPERQAEVRSRVQNAKVALGERGAPWWEAPTAGSQAERPRATIEALLAKRGAFRSGYG